MTAPNPSGNIRLHGSVIQYTSATYGDWSVEVDDVRIIGEATNQDGPFADDYFLCFAIGPGSWYEASFYATGRDPLLADLGKQFGVELQLRLMGSTDFNSRILWPIELEGSPMFEYRDVRPSGVIESLKGLIGIGQNRQFYSGQVLAWLDA